MNRFFTLCATMCILASVGSAQIAIDLVSATERPAQCYTILMTNDGEDLVLEGQNYRLYYNAAAATIDPATVTSLLPADLYADLVVKQDISHVDASGFGTLAFERDLGLLNFHIDHKTSKGRGLVMESGSAYEIAELCFDQPIDSQRDIVWAQRGVTHTYATAFNEVSLISTDYETFYPVSQVRYLVGGDDLVEQEADAEIELIDLSYYPNPFAEDLTIDFNAPLTERASVTVSTLFGEQVHTLTVEAGSTEAIIDGDALLDGAYVVAIETASGNYRRTIKALKIK